MPTDDKITPKTIAAADQQWAEFKEMVELFRTHQGPRLLALEDKMKVWFETGQVDLEKPERWFVYTAMRAAIAKAFVEISGQE